MTIRRGGFNEPYCSEDCYNKAGAEISGGFFQGIGGPCGSCQRNVHASSGIRLIPYRGAFLFICPACQSQAKDYVNGIHECCMCEKSLTPQLEETPAQMLNSGSFNNQQFKACPKCLRSKWGPTSPLSIFRCSCGTVYCDNCSGGGLIDLPRCPLDPSAHEDRQKVGYVPV
jgi:hypothetical protein